MCTNILSINYPFPRCKVVQNQKCTEWPKTDIKHLTVKSIQRPPKAQIVVHFALRPAVFKMHGRQQEAQGPWHSAWTEDPVNKIFK